MKLFTLQRDVACITTPSSHSHHRIRLNPIHASPMDAPERPTSNTTATTDDEKSQPDWTGNGMLSRAVNAAIGFPPLFSIMKIGARAAIKGTAEKRSVPWMTNVATLEATPEVFQLLKELETPSLSYPSYYTQPFHGYDEGNLTWLAAFECEPATDAMGLRVYKTETDLTPLQAQERVRMGILDAVHAFAEQHSLQKIDRTKEIDILDIGCSVGVSSRWLAHTYPAATVTGLDLSPYMLAVVSVEWYYYF